MKKRELRDEWVTLFDDEFAFTVSDDEDVDIHNVLCTVVPIMDLIQALVGYGYGVGEEAQDVLETYGVKEKEAAMAIDILKKAVKRYEN